MIFNKKSFKARECTLCGRFLTKKDYCQTKSLFFPDGYTPICRSCLSEIVVDQEGDWSIVDLICQWADVPFRPDDFTKIYKANPSEAMGLYLDMFSAAEYERISWKEYFEKWKEAIQEGNEREIHEVFNQKELDDLRARFGSSYAPAELYQLQGFYKGIEESYGFPDVIAEDNAKKMAKISFEIDRAIANREPIDKLITAYNKLQLQAGFTSDNARDMNSFESVSELALFYEKIGWEKKFHNNELNDVVDVTMRNIQAYNTRLWNNESTIVDQIEERVQQKKNIENIEERLEREDEITFETPTPLDEDDEVEDFEVEI